MAKLWYFINLDFPVNIRGDFPSSTTKKHPHLATRGWRTPRWGPESHSQAFRYDTSTVGFFSQPGNLVESGKSNIHVICSRILKSFRWITIPKHNGEKQWDFIDSSIMTPTQTSMHYRFASSFIPPKLWERWRFYRICHIRMDIR